MRNTDADADRRMLLPGARATPLATGRSTRRRGSTGSSGAGTRSSAFFAFFGFFCFAGCVRLRVLLLLPCAVRLGPRCGAPRAGWRGAPAERSPPASAARRQQCASPCHSIDGAGRHRPGVGRCGVQRRGTIRRPRRPPTARRRRSRPRAGSRGSAPPAPGCRRPAVVSSINMILPCDFNSPSRLAENTSTVSPRRAAP